MPYGLPSTGVGKAFASNPISYNFGEVLNGGNIATVAGARAFNSTSILSNVPTNPAYGTTFAVSISPNSSGNMGINAVFPGRQIAYMAPGKYIASLLTTTINGSGNTGNVLGGMASLPGRNPGRWYSYQRVTATAFDAYTGNTTYGASTGSSVLASGIDGTTGQFADKSVYRVDQGLIFRVEEMQGGPLPSSIVLPPEFRKETSIG